MGRNNRRSHSSHSRQHDRENKRNSFGTKNSSQNENNSSRFFSGNEYDDFHKDADSNLQSHENSLRELKSRRIICAKCGYPINELSSALADRQTGAPVHFDCVLDELSEQETLGENEKISYIGQGRFAVLHFDNMRDMRHFTIVKTIEWEARDSVYPWRTEMSGLYSHVE